MDMIGTEQVILREGSSAYPIAFIFAPCTTVDYNDGSIPFGTTISGAVITVTSVTGVDITSTVCAGGVSVVGGLRVEGLLAFPAGAPDGTCKVIVTLTLSDASVIAKRWDGLVIENDG